MSKWKLTTGTNEVHEEWVKGDIVFRKVTSLKSYIWYIYTSIFFSCLIMREPASHQGATL